MFKKYLKKIKRQNDELNKHSIIYKTYIDKCHYIDHLGRYRDDEDDIKTIKNEMKMRDNILIKLNENRKNLKNLNISQRKINNSESEEYNISPNYNRR